MKLKLAALIVCITLFLIGRAHASGPIYQVEPKSTGNTITLDVTNKLTSPLTNLSVVVLRRPGWVNVKNASVDAASLPVDSTGRISVAFDVLQSARRSEAGEVVVALFAGKSVIMQKTISLTVAVPAKYELAQNYPNPFNPSTTISFSLPTSSLVSLKVFDALGREVSTLVSEELAAGTYKTQWDASNVASGVYYYRLLARPTSSQRAGSFVQTKKLILLR